METVILYVQEVVTLQKRYSNIFASENKVYTDILEQNNVRSREL